MISWLADAAPTGMRGTAMSLRLSSNRLGQTIMTTIVGLVTAGANVSGVLWVAAGLLAAAGASAGEGLTGASMVTARPRN